MKKRSLIFISKVLIKILRCLGRNGSALPGLLIERLDGQFLSSTLKPSEKKIILITGTNGKTTSTKMLVEALRKRGDRVVTNSTGSNMTRGLIAAIVEDMTYFGSLKPTDWFVFEMDEAYTPIFTNNLSPRCLLALNILRDQLDRYGEIDKTAQMIGRAAQKADIFVYNGLDPLLKRLTDGTDEVSNRAVSFGVAKKLLARVQNEQSLSGGDLISKDDFDASLVSFNNADNSRLIEVLSGDNRQSFYMPVEGFHNAMNMTAVYAVLKSIIGDDVIAAMKSLRGMPTPFGRGEKLNLMDKNITVALVKNPSGFINNLETFVKTAKPDAVLFVINDKVADGRDVSWLWDVDFGPYIDHSSKLYASGIRAADMGLRLKHDNLNALVCEDISQAVSIILSKKSSYNNIVIIPTYTALFEVRDALKKYGKVPKIW